MKIKRYVRGESIENIVLQVLNYQVSQNWRKRRSHGQTKNLFVKFVIKLEKGGIQNDRDDSFKLLKRDRNILLNQVSST